MSQQSTFYFSEKRKDAKEKIIKMFDLKQSTSKDVYDLYKNSKTIAEIDFYNDKVSVSFYEHVNEKELNEIIKVIKTIYKIIKSNGFAKNEYDGEDGEYELFPDAKTFEEISTIWSARLFTPNEVKKYGREKLLNAPCEVIEELEDGAIFTSIHANRFSSTYEERKKLREYLGEK